MAIYTNTHDYVVSVKDAYELASDIYDLVAKEANRGKRQLFAVQDLEVEGDDERYLLRFGELQRPEK